MSQNISEVLRLSRSANRDSPNLVPAKKERRRSVRGRRSEVVVCPDTTNSPGLVISTQNEEMKDQRSKRRDLLAYKAILEAELEGWDKEMEAANLRKRKEMDMRRENIDRDISIERCGLYRSLEVEDPAVIYASVLKRVDDYCRMSAEEAVIDKVEREGKSEKEESERNNRLINNFRDVLTSETDEELKEDLEYWQGIVQAETSNIATLDSLIRELESQL
ncbi:hypothetical protein PMAYCL1PPCAC_06683 [Pristionchus mayeri]|uniref:Uncharacterized protein n=1 Tax=Pristionchus mayeri TaxID=1317129 RepID=A0AAN4Z8K6_9BILA|nr:hypothetical protein PMAYCL1PPCAC_06683 [Pristionchus mayeri]